MLRSLFYLHLFGAVSLAALVLIAVACGVFTYDESKIDFDDVDLRKAFQSSGTLLPDRIIAASSIDWHRTKVFKIKFIAQKNEFDNYRLSFGIKQLIPLAEGFDEAHTHVQELFDKLDYESESNEAKITSLNASNMLYGRGGLPNGLKSVLVCEKNSKTCWLFLEISNGLLASSSD